MNKIINKLLSICLSLCFILILTFIYFNPVSASKVLAKTSETYLQYTNVKKFSDNDMVEVIVVLESESLLDLYNENNYSSISDYAVSEEGQRISSKLNREQNKIIDLIEETNITIDLSNSYNYTIVMNAISFQTKVKNLDKIAELSGVKDIMISNSYDALQLETNIVDVDNIVYTDLFMDSQEAAQLGYTGKGMAVAILDTGTDINHEVFQGSIENPRFSKESLTEVIQNTDLTAKGVSTADVVYHSEKIPYAFDYAGNDSVAYIKTLEHGTHVAGIVGANSGEIRGTAVDAQLFIMKVFDDDGIAYDTYILAGVEDCLKLGVDVANMSLGSACGSSYTTEQVAQVYSQVREKGLNLICAAGNDSFVGNMNVSGSNLPLASAPDYGVVASPSTYEYALSVGSLDNRVYTAPCLNFEDKVLVQYAQTANMYPISIKLDGQTLEFVVIPNVGNSEDYEGIDVKGKVVLVPRGIISFTEKHNAAVAAGAVAMIVYDPSENELLGMQIDNQSIPAVFITNDSFLEIQKANVKTITFTADDYYVINNPTSGQLSSFSSWGTTIDLQIKPEIVGPGGYIYSALPEDLYAEMSGTSMASPNIAGVAALIRQYVIQRFPNLSSPEVVDLVNQLLMSTANPIINTNGAYTSIKAQGSGVANAMDAISTNGLVSVVGSDRPKAELGSSGNGIYKYTLVIKNIGNAAIEYTLNTVAMTDEYIEFDEKYYSSLMSKILTSEEVEVIYSNNVINNKIIVDVNETVEVDVTIKLSSQYKETQDEIFINGSYIEGYTFLNATTDQQLVVPFLGYYGDFEKLPLLEDSVYEEDAIYNMLGSFGAIFNGGGTGYELGYDVASGEFYKDYIYYSNSNMKQNLLTSYNALYRNIDFAKFEIIDEYGNIVYESSGENYKKAFFLNNGGYVTTAYDYEGWDGIKPDGTKVVNGEKYTYTTTVGIYEDDGVTIAYQESWSFDFKIDSTAPEFLRSEIVVEDDITYLDIYANDNVSASFATIYSFDFNYQLAATVSNVDGKKTSKFRFNLDEIVEYIEENNIDASQIKVEICDWAYNFIYQNIVIGPSAIRLDSEYKVAINGNKDLLPILIPANVNKNYLTYESSDERIATVDENGVVTGISEGEAIITVSGYNGVTATTKIIVGGAVDTSITIINGDLELEIDDVEYLRTEILPLNTVDKTVKWISSDESVVKVSGFGKIVAIGVGTATITAISSSGNVDTITVIVNHKAVSSLYIYSSFKTLYVGESKAIDMITVIPFIEDYSNIVFTSSDNEILTVSSNGVLTALKSGTARITASSLDGNYNSHLDFIVSNVNATKIETQKQLELLMGSTLELEAVVYPINTTDKTIVFNSKNPSVVLVDENGIVTSVNIGTAEVEISCGQTTTSCYITVLPLNIESISSDEQLIKLNVGEEKVLKLTVLPVDATFVKFFYSSSDSNIVEVVNGKITAKSDGVATIFVTTINGVSYEFYIIVSKIEKDYIIRETFDDISTSVSNNYYTLDLSADEQLLTFSSNNENVAIVSNGNIYLLGEGTAKIYVYNQEELIDTFTVDVSGIKDNNNYVLVIMETVLVMSIVTLGAFVILKTFNRKSQMHKND